MGSFSIWHWLIVFLFFGLPIWFAVRSAKRTTDPVNGPSSFGGWLLLLAIAEVMGLLKTLASVASSMETYAKYSAVEGGELVAVGEAALSFALVILQVVVIWFMFKKDRMFPRLFFYQWIAIPVAFVLDLALVSSVLGVSVNQLLKAEVVGPSVAAFIVTGLWVWYVSKSVRVRNTFSHQARVQHEIFS
ncbi:hypothetical protein FHT72_003757 [Rhizobium sp. BK077]|uniref:DUF2569 family protein n=1 Tax=unclassified Rhizobium TaxID=2613769 RepID=UPI0016124875|nr:MULTISPECIES: DUF2569 family protein [unclassified Rhizobium]MBB3299464.1 hypothetical protein [Rhizobium sp. BK112]MBB3369268.1 hypothetical protein [Rhizobium sp. BK077]MBB4179354.1 hypothetical protein [Rhizobium sp. BK109]